MNADGELNLYDPGWDDAVGIVCPEISLGNLEGGSHSLENDRLETRRKEKSKQGLWGAAGQSGIKIAPWQSAGVV